MKSWGLSSGVEAPPLHDPGAMNKYYVYYNNIVVGISLCACETYFLFLVVQVQCFCLDKSPSAASTGNLEVRTNYLPLYVSVVE